MSYEDFVCFVQTKMKERLGEETEVVLQRIRKNNDVVLDGLSIQEQGSTIAPTIYLNHFYYEYERGMTMPDILDCIEAMFRGSRKRAAFDPGFYSDFSKVKGQLVCKLIHRARNRELLEDVPYQPFLDLAVVVCCRVRDEVIGNATILVHTRHMERWGIGRAELFSIARENTRRMLPEIWMDIHTVLGESGEDERSIPMFVLTNREKFYGAANIIFDSVLERIGKKLKENFWILPSSIHECILVPESAGLSREELEAMVQEVNLREVSEEEFLSDQVYYYERTMHRLTL